MVAAGFAATVALAACGSASPGEHHAGGALAGENGVASKSPAQILAAASAALRGAQGFVAEGSEIKNGRRVAIKFILASSHALQASISSGASSAEIIVLPNAAFIRASKAFWTSEGAPPAMQRFADRWLEVPAADVGSLYSQLGAFTPSTLASCLGRNHGTLTKAGTTTVMGQPAVVIKDDGNAPGAAPGTAAIATSGPPYPLESTRTGPRRPGGTITACNKGQGNHSVGTVSLSDFGHVPPITPPPNPIRLGPTTAA